MKTRIVLTCCAATLLAYLPAVAVAQWSDNFDGYANGTVLHDVGGWYGWDNVQAVAGIVTDAQARSAPHSVMLDGGDGDAVRPYTGYTSGQWVFTAWHYVPSNLDDLTYFIMNNIYNHGGPHEWTIEWDFNPVTGQVHDPFRDAWVMNPLPIIFDAWAEIRIEFDLDNDTVDQYYDNQLLMSGIWTVRGGPAELAAVDLYGPHMIEVYFDDLSLVSAGGDTRGDLNCDGAIDSFDIDPFVLALTDPAGYQAQYPNCNIMNGDINCDGAVDSFDIDGFVECIVTGTCPPCP